MSYFNRGLAYYYCLGQYQRAIQAYDKAIQLDPDDAKAYNNRGFAYHNLSQEAEAYADKAKACSLDSQYCSKPSPTRTPTPITLPITATPCPRCDVANLVWPSVHTFRPKTGMAGVNIEVEGNGEYYYLDGAYDESARSSDLYFGGKKAGSIVCYVNGCFGSFNVPVGTPPRLYEVKSKGGPPSDIKRPEHPTKIGRLCCRIRLRHSPSLGFIH